MTRSSVAVEILLTQGKTHSEAILSIDIVIWKPPLLWILDLSSTKRASKLSVALLSEIITSKISCYAYAAIKITTGKSKGLLSSGVVEALEAYQTIS